jgi:hypothetical protein
MPKNLEEE